MEMKKAASMVKEKCVSSDRSDYHRRWAQENREHLREYYKNYHDLNRETILEKKRIYNSQAENKERNYALMKKWRAANPIEQRLHRQVRHANAQAKKYGLIDRIGIKDVRNLPHYCIYCGTRAKLTVDHIHPISKGGANQRPNLTTACLPCNQKKSAKILNEAIL